MLRPERNGETSIESDGCWGISRYSYSSHHSMASWKPSCTRSAHQNGWDNATFGRCKIHLICWIYNIFFPSLWTFENFNLPPFLDSLTTPVAGRNLHCSLAYFLGSMLSSLQKSPKNQQWLNIYLAFLHFFAHQKKKVNRFLRDDYQPKKAPNQISMRINVTMWWFVVNPLGRLAKVPAQ